MKTFKQFLLEADIEKTFEVIQRFIDLAKMLEQQKEIANLAPVKKIRKVYYQHLQKCDIDLVERMLLGDNAIKHSLRASLNYVKHTLIDKGLAEQNENL